MWSCAAAITLKSFEMEGFLCVLGLPVRSAPVCVAKATGRRRQARSAVQLQCLGLNCRDGAAIHSRANDVHVSRQPGEIPPSPPLPKGGGGGICLSAGVIVKPYLNGLAFGPIAQLVRAAGS